MHSPVNGAKYFIRFAAAVALTAPGALCQIITTVAGTNSSFPAGSLTAVNAPLGAVTGVAVDGTGNVFIVDSGDSLVFRISSNGAIEVVAGNGIPGFSGDGGPATSASLYSPSAVALDSAGNLYVADTGNERIRKVTVSDGTITTVAGSGTNGFSGDGGPAVNASFGNPTGVAVDSAGDIYIADTANARIRKVSGGTITTIAGNSTIGFSGDGGPATGASLDLPAGIAVDLSGSLYIADFANQRIRKVANGTITTVAGNGNQGYSGDGGPASTASINGPAGVAVDTAGNLYIADTGNNRVRKVVNGTITTIAGNANPGYSGDGGPSASASLDGPFGVAIDSTGNLYIADTSNSRVRRVFAGTIATIAGNGNYRFSGDGGPATSASLNLPSGVVNDSAGNLYIADSLNNRVRKSSGRTINTVAGSGPSCSVSSALFCGGFSGDGGSAQSASVSLPIGVAVDSAGDFFIADSSNNRIRKVSNGTITTVAGSGAVGFDSGGFSGDGGPATRALLSDPAQVAVDAAGNLYIADLGNSRIRKVSGGIITTVAGNQFQGFSGDGGPATSASLNLPSGVAVDAAGNLYIADTDNQRIRKVSGGIITTVAGNGLRGFSGDGGPATSASLNSPTAVAVDSAGNLFITDLFNNRIRVVSNGTITTIAGNGSMGFGGDGGPPASASLSGPNQISLDSVGNLYIADTGNDRIREVLVNPPYFNNPLPPGSSSLTLSQASGGKPVTTTLIADTSIAEGNSTAVPGMAYTASVISGSSWLSVSPQGGSTPGLITVTADPLNLPAGSYGGAIVVRVPLANPPVQTVNVQFAVSPGVPAAISTDQSHMSFTYATTSAARSQTLIVSNAGGGALNFTTSIALFSGQSAHWLSVSPPSGTVAPASPVALAVRADPSLLPAGTYTGSLTISAQGIHPVIIPMTMTITTNPLVLLLSQSGLTFTVVQNGGVVPPQTFGVLNLGSGMLKWSVKTSTLSGGNWLTANPATGSSDAGTPDGAPLVAVSVNPAGLVPGAYYGLVKVISPGAANTPQEVVAVLRVLPADTDVAPIVQPSSLIFSAPAGLSSPSSQTVLVYDPTGTGKSFTSTATGAGAVVTLPTDATIPPTGPTQIVVQPIVNGLAPGTYQGTLTLQFSDGRVSAVAITFVVTGAADSGSARPAPHDSLSCTATKLIPVLTTLGPGFIVPAGYPQGLTAQVADDCGNPLTQGQVSVEFSTGQGVQYMQSLNNGRWDVTWQTGSEPAASVILTVNATNPNQTIAGEAQISGALGALQASPQVKDGGVVSAATFLVTPLAPGGFISIFGSLLSDATGSAPVLPLSTQLNNTIVSLGDLPLPLFYTSAGQVNAVVPYTSAENTNLQLLVQRDNTYATPVHVDVAAAQPGILQQNGNMEAVAVDLNGNLIGPSNPAHAGNVLTLYCLGLGAVSPVVADGTAAPSNPPASTVNPVTVTIGGQNANVIFAGLTPTLAGLYQIDFTVPPNTGTGDQVQVVVSTGEQTSAAVNLSVR